jgi:transcriptional regulator with XRE-family HTH domain
MELKERLRALRKELDLTQEQLADRGDLERVEVVNLESGRNQATSIRILKGLARGFRLTLQDAMDLIDGKLSVQEARSRSGQAPEHPAVPDPLPHRAAAARLATEDGVYDAAIRSVLEEVPLSDSVGKSTLWWADRMRLRQHELVTNTGQIARTPKVPPPSPSSHGPVSHARPTPPPPIPAEHDEQSAKPRRKGAG